MHIGPAEFLLNCLIAGGAIVLMAVPLLVVYMIYTTSKRMNAQLEAIQHELRALQQQMKQQKPDQSQTTAAAESDALIENAESD